MQYKHSVLGGTFDHFHAGHEFFIESAFKSSDVVEIGLVENLIEEKKYQDSIEDYKTRGEELNRWLDEKGYGDRSLITPINDIYGNTLTQKDIQAIFVTEHGFQNAGEINKKRKEIKLHALEIVKVDFIRGEDQQIISSTRIRAGEIDRRGYPYINTFHKDLTLPDDVRSEVRNVPSGEVLPTEDDVKKFIQGKKMVISVGDIISENLINFGRRADISLVDGRTRRGLLEKEFSLAPTDYINNKSGTISASAARTLASIFKTGGRHVIKIEGEEDLLALPATLLAPLGAVVLYGMPDRGVNAVIVTENKKSEVKKNLGKI